MLAPYVSAKTVAVGSCLALLGGVLVATASAEQPLPPQRLVAAAEVGRAALPGGDGERSRAGLERSALRLAEALDAVPVREGGDEADRYCPPASLRVQWTPPSPSYVVGAHLDPVGPAPDDATLASGASVNGLVVCAGVEHAYMGFEAHWGGAAWVVTAVPSLSDEHGHEEPAEPAHEQEAEHDHAAEPAPAPPAAAAPALGLPGLASGAVGGVEPYARYDPQRTCDPVAKPGTSALSGMLLRTYPMSRSLGVSRTCTARGVSEHKEGRAFDWGVNVGVPAQRAAAESALSQLLATDAAGNRHALARRLGVMYLIWDRRIWSAYNPTAGWRPYSGASPHTDHVHISLSWDGAMGRTSFWQGANASLLQLDPALQLAFDPGVAGPSGGARSDGPVVAVPAPGAAGPSRRGKEHRREERRDDGEPAAEHGDPAIGRVDEGGPDREAREERSERRKARKADKRRAREAREAEAAATAAEQVAAQQIAAQQQAAQQQAAEQTAQPAPSRRGPGKGKGPDKGQGSRTAAATPPPAPEPEGRAQGKGSKKPKAIASAPAGGKRSGGSGGRGGGGKAARKGGAPKPAEAPAGQGKRGRGSGKAAGKPGEAPAGQARGGKGGG